MESITKYKSTEAVSCPKKCVKLRHNMKILTGIIPMQYFRSLLQEIDSRKTSGF
jgi:hypothetical protein